MVIVIFICGCSYRRLLLDLPATDVEILPSAALRCGLTHKSSVFGLDCGQIVPLIEAVFSGKSSQFGQDLFVDSGKKHILVSLASLQLLKALTIRQKVQCISKIAALSLKNSPGTPVHLRGEVLRVVTPLVTHGSSSFYLISFTCCCHLIECIVVVIIQGETPFAIVGLLRLTGDSLPAPINRL